MGLDQYAFAIPKNDDNLEFAQKIPDDIQRFFYWRKHPNLHGWMEDLFTSRGGAGDFNCVSLLVTAGDLDKLEKDVRGDKLPMTNGFFFGASSDEDRNDDLEFIRLARQKISEGYDIYYDSWW